MAQGSNGNKWINPERDNIFVVAPVVKENREPELSFCY